MRLRGSLYSPESGTGSGGGSGGAPATPAAQPPVLPAAPAAPAVSSVVTGGDGPPVTAPATWPEDWRAQLAGSDEKVLKRLERFASFNDVWKSFQHIEKKMSSGDKSSEPPAEPEALAVWRTEHGLPADPKGYYEKMGDLIIGDDDKARADLFFGVAHEANLPPDAAKKLVTWSYQYEEQLLAERLEQDEAVKQEGMQTLLAEWGNEYKGNLNAINGVLDMFPADAKAAMLDARDENGDPIMSNPEILRGFVMLANEVNPGHTLLPAGMSGGLNSIESQIQEILNVMRIDRARYNSDAGMQAKLLALNDAKTRLQARQ